jgi:hypothetical protein
MTTPSYSDAIQQINTYIVANGNNEITANVLNPILKIITDFVNNSIGNLSNLTTAENNNLVGAINSLITSSENNNIQLFTGNDKPINTPPASFNYGDFYMELSFIDNLPVELWQWNGFDWITNAQSNSDVFNPILVISDGTTNDVILPIGFIVKSVLLNKAFLYNISEWNQSSNILTITNNLINLDEIYITN